MISRRVRLALLVEYKLFIHVRFHYTTKYSIDILCASPTTLLSDKGTFTSYISVVNLYFLLNKAYQYSDIRLRHDIADSLFVYIRNHIESCHV